MDLSLSITLLLELSLFALIVILNGQQVVIVLLPVLFCGFSFQNLVVSFYFQVIHLPVLVCNYVVFACGGLANEFFFVFLNKVTTKSKLTTGSGGGRFSGAA